MSDVLEAVVTLLPPDVGGRLSAVTPRDGSYRPFARVSEGGPLLRVRFIEGPPRLAPGETGRVVLEVESATGAEDLLFTGAELELIELESRPVGLVTVARVWRGSLAL